jgi:hypothetical protein
MGRIIHRIKITVTNMILNIINHKNILITKMSTTKILEILMDKRLEEDLLVYPQELSMKENGLTI